MFFKISVVNNFALFTGKHLCWCLILIQFQARRKPRCFSVNVPKFLRTAFFIEHLFLTKEIAVFNNCRFSFCLGIFLKVASVVNLKLAFKDWFLYNLIKLIELWKIRYLNLDKVLSFPRNQVIVFEKLKTLFGSNYQKVS